MKQKTFLSEIIAEEIYFPEIEKLISYQDTEVHTGTIYKGVVLKQAFSQSGSGIQTKSLMFDLESGTEYTWTIDTVVGSETLTGVTWTFTTEANLPEKVITPYPANAATDIKFTATNFTWIDPGTGETIATSFEIFVDDVSIGVVTEPTIAIPTPILPQEYSWRVDSTNDNGTTTGDTWTFTVDDDPLINVEDGGIWYGGGKFKIDVYTPDSNATIRLANNSTLDNSGEVVGSEVELLQTLSTNWSRYEVKVPFNCELGSFYVKWNYNDE